MNKGHCWICHKELPYDSYSEYRGWDAQPAKLEQKLILKFKECINLEAKLFIEKVLSHKVAQGYVHKKCGKKVLHGMEEISIRFHFLGGKPYYSLGDYTWVKEPDAYLRLKVIK